MTIKTKSPLFDALMEHADTAKPPATPEQLARLQAGIALAQLETLDRIARALESLNHHGLTTYAGEI